MSILEKEQFRCNENAAEHHGDTGHRETVTKNDLEAHYSTMNKPTNEPVKPDVIDPPQVGRAQNVIEAILATSESVCMDTSSPVPYTIPQRLRKYITKISAIEQGGRNAGLYQTGIILRGNFGLTGDDLALVLLVVNNEKCVPPLPEDEVATIARSVDRANISPGSRSFASGLQCHNRFKPESRTEHYISLSAETMPTDTLLQKQISIYSHCWENIPVSTAGIGEMLESFRVDEESGEHGDEMR